MPWLPSFVKLFLLFVLGLVLNMGGAMAQMAFLGDEPTNSFFGVLHLVGLLLLVACPLLMALKFFARLDQKAK